MILKMSRTFYHDQVGVGGGGVEQNLKKGG